MSKQAILFSLGAVVVLGLVAAGNAQPGDGRGDGPGGERGRAGGRPGFGGPGEGGPRGGPPAPEEIFREIDADGDGVISQEEFLSHHEERFGGRGPGGPPDMNRGGGEFGFRGPMGPPPRHDHDAQLGPPPHEMHRPMGPPPPPRGDFCSDDRGRGPRGDGRGAQREGCRCAEQGPPRHHGRWGDDRGGEGRGGEDRGAYERRGGGGHHHGPPPPRGEGRGPRGGERSRPELESESETDSDTTEPVAEPTDVEPTEAEANAA